VQNTFLSFDHGVDFGSRQLETQGFPSIAISNSA
jgi:hypothetical protein